MRHAIPALMAVLLLAGCTTTSVTLKLEAIEPVNKASADGDSRVVEVRVFELKDRAKFEQSSTEDIWDNAEGTLGGDLLSVRNADPVYPQKESAKDSGTTVVIDPINAETKFIGVLALMTESDDKGKRHIAVALGDAESVVFRITGYHVELRKK
ncbi:MAG: type VI secretion system lipoprotein TssJ [Planctomycetes bacterium]|nr:type VI secretion system lipoprotein TssJ [Planctomycetota bacterium]MCW8135158.1 type VI secretion system lipoprotein TssJ [Planctomycetota bacterium]